MDVLFLRHILDHEPSWRTEFIVVEDGDEALDYLNHPDTLKPDLVVLDLNLPKRDGIELLREIRLCERLYGLRVAVFSCSPEEMIRKRLSDAQVTADEYIHKPTNFESCSTLARRFHECCGTN